VQPRVDIVGSALSPAPLRWIGRISYGLYLWHWPIYLVVTPDRSGLDGAGLLGVRLAITFAFATASFYLVEMPVRRGRWLARPRFAFATVAVAVVVLVLTFVGIPRLRGTETPALATTTRIPAGRLPSRVLVVGDSVATSLGAGLAIEGEAAGIKVFNRGRDGCALTHEGDLLVNGIWSAITNFACPHWLAGWKRDAAETAPEVAVVLNDVWVLQDLRIDGKVLRFGSAASDRYLLGQLDRGVRALLAGSPRVVLLTTPYNGELIAPGNPLELHPELVSQNDPRRVDHLNDLLRRTAEKFADEGVTLIDLNAFVSPQGYTKYIDGTNLRADGVHFETPAAQIISRWLLPRLST
jgi:hypothetical protein